MGKASNLREVYDRPDGVFYNFLHDYIYTLEWTGAQRWNMKTNVIQGKFYKYRSGDRGTMKNVLLVDVEKTSIRLGDL